MARLWNWTSAQGDQYSVQISEKGIVWESDVYDERAGNSERRSRIQPNDDFLQYGPDEQAPPNVVRELAAQLGLADPPWLKPLDPRVEKLLAAADAGNLEAIHSALASGVDANVSDQRGYTPLWKAIVRGRSDAALLLIDAGADIHRRYRYGDSALRLAAKHCDVQLAQRLLALNADVNAVEAMTGETPLLSAIEKRQPAQLVQLLIDAGRDVNHARRDGGTALIRAVRNGLLDVVRALIKAGARVDVRDQEGLSPLLHAARFQPQGEFYDALLAAGASVDDCDKSGTTALASAANKNHREGVRRLLAAGANIHARGALQTTAIMHAIYNARPDRELFELLLKAGADIEARREDGATPLIIASSVGAVTAVQLLLERGADVAAKDQEGMTALAHATAQRKSEVVKLLSATTPGSSRRP